MQFKVNLSKFRPLLSWDYMVLSGHQVTLYKILCFQYNHMVLSVHQIIHGNTQKARLLEMFEFDSLESLHLRQDLKAQKRDIVNNTSRPRRRSTPKRYPFLSGAEVLKNLPFLCVRVDRTWRLKNTIFRVFSHEHVHIYLYMGVYFLCEIPLPNQGR